MDYVSVLVLLIAGESGLLSYQLFQSAHSLSPQQLIIIYLNAAEKNHTSTKRSPKPYTSFAIHYHFYLPSQCFQYSGNFRNLKWWCPQMIPFVCRESPLPQDCIQLSALLLFIFLPIRNKAWGSHLWLWLNTNSPIKLDGGSFPELCCSLDLKAVNPFCGDTEMNNLQCLPEEPTI